MFELANKKRSSKRSSLQKTKIILIIVVVSFIAGLLIGGYWARSMYVAGQSSSTKIYQTERDSYTSIKSLEKVHEVVFVTAGIQDVERRVNSTKLLWTKLNIPLSKKQVILILNYEAKFGIDKSVQLQKDGNTIHVTVPKFKVIGVKPDEKIAYQVFDSSGQLLSGSTKDIDTGKVVIEQLSTKKQTTYLKHYNNLLKESATNYYQSVIHAIDKKYQVKVTFAK